MTTRFAVVLCIWACFAARTLADDLIPVGAARVKINPTNRVRMMGYAARANLPAPTNTALNLHTRALAIGGGTNAAVLVTIDNCILPGGVSDEIRSRLFQHLGVAPERLAISVTHTHSAPCLTGAAPNIFAQDIGPDDQREIDVYTRWLIDRVEEAVRIALEQRAPARLEWGQGNMDFAKNRRTPGGPVDHVVPVLRVTAPDGTVRAVWANYACHCTTLGGEFNQYHGDWASVAAHRIEADFRGGVGLVSIGCGADSNPDPRGTIGLVNRHGEALAAETRRVAKSHLLPITAAPVCSLQTIQLPFEKHFTRDEWAARATNSGIVGYHARKWLARLDRGEVPSPTLPYPVQTWRFGDDLAIVFLGGEVVVDYALRLKSELDPARLWVNGYVNEVPCYIPSRRILSEGGYEAETSLWYYDRPQRLSPAIEDLIIQTVKEQLPASWRIEPRQLEFPKPKSPPEALKSFRYDGRFELQVAASEPLIESPVAIDFAADGRLWVCEMFDYPNGGDGQGKPAGRVKVLTDDNHDGRFDRADLVADDLPFPTGLMAWGDGVIVCAAPDVVYLTPRAGGGYERRTLLTGFATHNFQARVNGLRWGLDAWVYGSGGLFGGKIRVLNTTMGKKPATGDAVIDCSNRDFRWRPDTGEFEALAGVSQQGRVADDFGEWFGNDNSSLLWHFPLPDRYARRNPYLAPPDTRVGLNRDGNRVYPASRTLVRFNDPQAANQLTSACGIEVYRDELLGAEFAGNAFVCEPVHNLVRRAAITPDGASFAARRNISEQRSEFFASTDNWSRPVEVRTGPDGALWIVDFYRFVIEHPRWIPSERLRELDVRAGANLGRIYRLVPVGQRLRPVENLRTASVTELARALRSPNGVVRDLVHRELLDRARSHEPREPIAALLGDPAGATPAGSDAQRYAILRQVGTPVDDRFQRLLTHSNARLRRFALQLLEPGSGPAPVDRQVLPRGMAVLANDPDFGLRYQLALTLGEFRGIDAGETLANLAHRDGANPWMRAAILSSVLAHPSAFVARFHQLAAGTPVYHLMLDPLLRTLSGASHVAGLAELTRRTFGQPTTAGPIEAYALLSLANSKPELWSQVLAQLPTETRKQVEQAEAKVNQQALASATGAAPENERLPALRHLAGLAAREAGHRRAFLSLISSNLPPDVREEWLRLVPGINAPEMAVEVLAFWPALPLAQRGAFLTSLLSREAWAGALMEAIAAGRVDAGELTPAQRRQLREHPRSEISRSAQKLFPPPGADRAPLVAKFASAATLLPELNRGAEHFERLCASCHRLRGRGFAVGPDLSTFRAKPVGDFVTAILDPNAALDPRYLAYTAETTDGRTLTGVVRDETANGLTLVQSGGVAESLLRSQLRSLTPSPVSLMPEGLEQGLVPQDLADLVGWIKASPAPFGAKDANQVESARRKFVAAHPSGFTQPESSNETLSYPGWLGRLPLFYCRQHMGQNRLAWRSVAPAVFDGRLRFCWPAALGLASQPTGKFTLRLNGRPLVDFDVTLEDRTWAANEGRAQLRYSVMENNAEDSCGLLELEVDGAMLEPGSVVQFEVVGTLNGSQRWFGIYHLPGVN